MDLPVKFTNRNFSIYKASEIGLNFKNLIDDISTKNTLKDVLIWSTMESDLHGGNEKYDFNEMNLLCERNDITINIIFGILNQEYYDKINHHSKIKLHFWPTYLLNYTYNKFDLYHGIHINDLKKNLDFKKLFVCYNNKPHSHRCNLIDNLYHRGLFNHGEISWNLLNDFNYEFKFWKEEIIKTDDFVGQSFHMSNHIFDNSSFIFLVSESCDNIPFITEKTFKPILIEQPFICLGGKLQNINLKKLGFELYDEIFNYDFDYLEDINQRIDGVISNLIKIKNEDYTKLYKRIEDKIKYNKENAISIVKNKLYIPNIIIENNISFES